MRALTSWPRSSRRWSKLTSRTRPSSIALLAIALVLMASCGGGSNLPSASRSLSLPTLPSRTPIPTRTTSPPTTEAPTRTSTSTSTSSTTSAPTKTSPQAPLRRPRPRPRRQPRPQPQPRPQRRRPQTSSASSVTPVPTATTSPAPAASSTPVWPWILVGGRRHRGHRRVRPPRPVEAGRSGGRTQAGARCLRERDGVARRGGGAPDERGRRSTPDDQRRVGVDRPRDRRVRCSRA